MRSSRAIAGFRGGGRSGDGVRVIEVMRRRWLAWDESYPAPADAQLYTQVYVHAYSEPMNAILAPRPQWPVRLARRVVSPALFDFWATRVNPLWTLEQPLARLVSRSRARLALKQTPAMALTLG